MSDTERAVRFYTETLDLKLMYRGGPGYAAIDGGKGLEIGLHAVHEGGPRPGSTGPIHVGFYVDEPIAEVVARLRSRGAEVGDPRPGGGPITLASLADPDANPLYLCEINR